MAKSKLAFIVCFAILGLSLASLTLDEALNYSLEGKTCKQTDIVSVDREYIENYLKRYQSIESVRAEIDVLKKVRELIQ